MNTRRLYETKTLRQLVQLAEALPVVMTAEQRRESYAIDQAITWHQEDRRKGASRVYGNPLAQP